MFKVSFGQQESPFQIGFSIEGQGRKKRILAKKPTVLILYQSNLEFGKKEKYLQEKREQN